MIVCVDLVDDVTNCGLGQAMGNLASTYGALGRHQDALVLHEKTLQFRRRVLPENHPDIGITCYNLSAILAQVGDFPRAIERAREALCIWQATMPPSHPRVVLAQEQLRKIEDALVVHA